MEIWGEKYGILGIRGAQLYNYEDILLYSTDDKVYFLPATHICREEMSLEATFPLNSDHEEYAPLCFLSVSHNRQLLSCPSAHLVCSSSPFFTFTSFASNNFSCWTRDNKNSFRRVTLAVAHNKLRSIIFFQQLLSYLFYYLFHSSHISHNTIFFFFLILESNFIWSWP